jgi:Flp pilus assembly protein TadD
MLTNSKPNAMKNRLARGVAAITLAAVLAGCATDRITTGSINRGASASNQQVAQMSADQLRSASQQMGQQYARSPSNPEVAMRYAALLQMEGQAEQSLAVMRKLAIEQPSDRQVLAAYGKSLAAAGQLEAALDAIRRAQTPEYPDWKLLSAEGAILDQLGQPAEARQLYRRALDLAPNEPSVLSNIGMSYVLEGDLRSAETQLRAAAAAPNADSRVRQNLALVIGLQGRFAEAEEIASRELSPEQAQANVAYLRSMLAQQNAWNELQSEETNTN